MNAKAVVLLGLGCATAGATEAVLPPAAATVVQTALDDVHADPRCAAWRQWTEIEVQGDRVVLRPSAGPGRAMLVRADLRPWLRYDVDQSDQAPSDDAAAQCLQRGLSKAITHSMWLDPGERRDRARQAAAQWRTSTPGERSRSPIAVWSWVCVAVCSTALMAVVALRRLLGRADGL